jgi:ABC-type bacteriocin/lantibiotic exporter with double-glycine peptidase domain
MWFIFENFKEIFECFWDYADYSSSLVRINTFLSLPQKDDNLEKLKLTKEIKTIHFKNVYFKYKSSPSWVLKNYTRTFVPGKLNHLTGKNGTGKSTILYLMLGLVEPNQGFIIITDYQGQSYNLPRDINLQHWREYLVAYCAHETLLEAGSTGQKQLANIANTLTTKKAAQLFLFDEADNTLDKESQIKFYQQLEKLAKSKLVIYVKHEANEKLANGELKTRITFY